MVFKKAPTLNPIGMFGKDPLILPNNTGNADFYHMDRVPVNPNDIVNKAYVDSHSGITSGSNLWLGDLHLDALFFNTAIDKRILFVDSSGQVTNDAWLQFDSSQSLFTTNYGSFQYLWSNNGIYTGDGGKKSVDSVNRQLIANDGTTNVLDWSSTTGINIDTTQLKFGSSVGSPYIQRIGDALYIEPYNTNGEINLDEGNLVTAGNITSYGNVSGAYIYGDGSNLTNLPSGTQLSGSGFVKASGAVITYDNSVYEPKLSGAGYVYASGANIAYSTRNVLRTYFSIMPYQHVTASSTAISGSTLMKVMLINIPEPIQMNIVSGFSNAGGVSGAYKIAMFSEDGQTKHWEVQTATVGRDALHQTTISGGYLCYPGNYYLAYLAIDSAALNFTTMAPVSGSSKLNNLSGARKITGNITVTANTIPSTFDPVAMTVGTNGLPLTRFDT